VTFPDIPECITEGDDMEEAYQIVVDALGLALTEKNERRRKTSRSIKSRRYQRRWKNCNCTI